jgi:2'-5' RNA ligase
LSHWQTFLKSSHTLGPSPGVREQWHAGRRDYAVWALPVRDREVLERAEKVQRDLAGHIQPVPLDQLHITVWVGGFLDGDGTRNDDLDRETQASINRQIQAWRQPILVRITGTSSFQSCPYLQVEVTGPELESLREKVGSVHRNDLCFSPFTPHVTLGTYTAAHAAESVAELLRPHRARPPIPLSLSPAEGRVDAHTGTLNWV